MDVWSAGPVKAAQRQADPQQLATLVSTLEIAVGAHMKRHTTPYVLPPPEPVSQSASADSAVHLLPGRHAVLHGLDSTTMAASFGCAAHLMQTHRKLRHTLTTPRGGGQGAPGGLIPTGVTPPATSSAGKVPLSQPANRTGHATAPIELQVDQAETCDDADKDGHVDMSDGAEMLQHVTGQVQWLTDILKLPWQLQCAGTQVQPGR